MLNILLLSSSSYKETGYLTHAKNLIENFLEECDVKQDPILFIPYAGVRRNNEEYEKKSKRKFK